jgi:protocatechuate 3,4-dioxygenase alpha subunit
MSEKALLPQTPSQTVGPYFAYGLTAEQYGYANTQIATGQMAGDGVPGTRVRIEGAVYDADGKTVPDAMIEFWQADSTGRVPAGNKAGNAGFTGFGRQGTGVDAAQRFVFETVKPGRVDDEQAPHIVVIVFMRGLLTHLYTRLYFEDEAEANVTDPVLQSVPAERRHTLIAKRQSQGLGDAYRFDIRLQGPDETVFFDV